MRAALLLLLAAARPCAASEGERPWSTYSPFTRYPAHAAVFPGYLIGGVVGVGLCVPVSLKGGHYGGCTYQMADAFGNAMAGLVGAPFALLEWTFWRGPRRLMGKEIPISPGAALPQALTVEATLPPGVRLLGGLSGALRIEATETMTHAVEHRGASTPITFGYDPAGPAFIVEEQSLPGGRTTYPLKPPYPVERYKLTITGGHTIELQVTPVAQ